MIKFTGTIVGSNGVATYTNGVINLNISMPDAFSGAIVNAEVGEKVERTQNYEIQEPIEVNVLDESGSIIGTEPGTKVVVKEKTITAWQKLDIVESFGTTKKNPSFEQLQDEMSALLKSKYQTVQFEII